MVSHYLLPYILHPTRITDHSATIIDNIFSTNCEYDTVSGNLLSQISDYFPQFLIIKNASVDYRNCSLFQRDYSKFSDQPFSEDFKKLSWNDIDRNNLDINSKFEKFYEKVHHTVIEHAPLRKVTLDQLKLWSKPWINTHIQKLIKQKGRLLRKLRKSHSRDTEELYKKFRNRVVSENRKSKIKYFDNYFSTNQANMKNLWTGIETITNTKSKSSLQNISELVVNEKIHQDPQQMAMFLMISLSMFPIKSILKSQGQKRQIYLKNRNTNFFFVRPITHNEIEDIILSLKMVSLLDPSVYL